MPSAAGGADGDTYWLERPDDGAARSARQFLRRQLGDHIPTDLLERAELCVSELVTMAVDHAPGPLGVTIRRRPGILRVAVHDTSANPPRFDPAGWAARIVQGACDRFAIENTATGKQIWCDFDLAPAEDES